MRYQPLSWLAQPGHRLDADFVKRKANFQIILFFKKKKKQRLKNKTGQDEGKVGLGWMCEVAIVC